MAEEQASLREVHWRQICPWLALFRVFGIALDLKKLFLGALGVLATSLGWWLLAGAFGSIGGDTIDQQAKNVRHWPWDPNEWHPFEVAEDAAAVRVLDEIKRTRALAPEDRQALEARFGKKQGVAIVEELVHSPQRAIPQLATNWKLVFRPLIELKRPFQSLFQRNGFLPSVFAFACGLWAVAVWAVFGGAITRIAAVQFARDERVGLMEALRFSTGKFLSYAAAPVIPMIFIVVILVPCIIGGLIGAGVSKLGWAGGGAMFAGSLWFLPLLASFAITIIAIMWAIGWPLMFSTISAEGSDSFDALSRSWSYSFQRPWHYLFYALLAAGYGSLCSFFVLLFADVLVYSAQWAVAFGDFGMEQMPELLSSIFYYAPPASGWASSQSAEAPSGLSSVAAVFTGFWLYVLFLLLVGFVYSYFWSASTAIYFLLRRDVDNTEMQEVYLEGAEDEMDMPGIESPGSPVVAPASSPAAGTQ